MDNRTAEIAEPSLDRAITRFGGSVRVTRAMALRPSLPITVAERLVALVSNELQRHLVKAHALSPGIVSDIVSRSREQVVVQLSQNSSEAELAGMVTQMHHNGRLTPTLMLRALCTGDIAFFEAAMAVKGDVPVANARILIHEPGRRGLGALYRKAAMPENLFEAICAAIDAVHETGFDGKARDLERFRARILVVKESIDPADVADLIDIARDAPG
jgi:uncharacterized protein (DUF2336 family)